MIVTPNHTESYNMYCACKWGGLPKSPEVELWVIVVHLNTMLNSNLESRQAARQISERGLCDALADRSQLQLRQAGQLAEVLQGCVVCCCFFQVQGCEMCEVWYGLLQERSIVKGC